MRIKPNEKVWGDVFWRHVCNGVPREEAAYRTDEWEKRKKRKRRIEERSETKR